jgi:hypothetical protein
MAKISIACPVKFTLLLASNYLGYQELSALPDPVGLLTRWVRTKKAKSSIPIRTQIMSLLQAMYLELHVKIETYISEISIFNSHNSGNAARPQLLCIVCLRVIEFEAEWRNAIENGGHVSCRWGRRWSN